MATVAQLDVRIGADIKSFQQGMAKLENQLKQVGSNLRNTGRQLSTAVTLPLLGIGAAAVKAASDAEEMQSKFNTVFKTVGGDVTKQLDAFARASGRSRYELQGMAGQLGDIFKPLGYTEQQAGDLSVQVAKLAVDLGSFNNMPMDEALARLRGTLVGSHENALAFAVTINEASLKQELMRMGADKLTGAQLNQAKVQARLNLLMAGTTDAQGDAIRTSDSFANQFQRLRNATYDLGVTIGELLLPYANQLVRRLQGMVDYVQNLNPETQKLGIILAGVAAAAGPLVFSLGGVASGFSAIMRAVTLTMGLFNPYVAGLAAVAAIFVGLTRGSDSVQAAFKTFGDQIKNSFSPIWEGLKETIAETYGVIVGWWSANGEAVKTTLTETFTTLITNVGTLLGTLAEVFRLAWQATENVTKLFIGENGTLETLFVSGTLNLVNSVGATIALLAATINTTIEQIAGALKATTLAAGGKFDQAFQALKDIPKSNIDAMLAFFASMKSDIDASIDPDIAKDAAEAVVGKDGETFADKVKRVIDSAVSGFTSFATDIVDPLQNDPDSVSNTVGDTAEDIDGLKNSVDGLFKISVDPKTLNEAVRAIAPSEDEVSRMDSFRHHFKRFAENLSDVKGDAFNVARYTRDVRDALDTLGIGADTPFGRFVSNTANLALDIATVVNGFSSLIELFKLEIWGKTLDLFIKIGSAIWDIVSGLFAQQQVQNVGATIGAIGPGTMGPTVNGVPDLTTTGGSGLAGLLGGATIGATFGIFGYGLQQMLADTQQSLLEQGLSTAQVGTAISLAGLLQGVGSMGGSGTPSWLSGLQGYMGTSGSANTSGVMGSMGMTTGGQTINVNLDGQTIATATMPYWSQELEIYGTNR